MAGAAGEFVEGWLVAQVLGEGAYGEVRLLVHARTGARVALKAAGGEGLREAALHRALRHRHVLRCLGARAHRGLHYLFLEYAPGGELFERIEPDAGMAPAAARRYWRQLAHGLRYLHARGVAHRDIKPENLLLDARDDIKISDFGLATLFRHGARERRLARVCGTLPYAAPEVHGAPARPYRAPPADAWAAAVVLLAMLVGELPWERAHPEEPRYAAWARWVEAGAGAGGGALPGGVWARAGGALAWLARALHPSPARRAPLADLLLDAWMHDAPPPNAPPLLIVSRPLVSPGATGSHSKNACRIKMNCTRKRRRDQERARAPSQASQPLVSSSRYTTINKSGRDPPRNRRRTALFIELLRRLRRQANFTKPAGSRGCLSQPAGAGAGGAGAGVEEDGELAAAAMEAMLSASQPAAADDLLLSTQLAPLAGSDALEAEGVCGVARRLARVWVCGAETEALRCVAAALERLRCAVRRVDARTLAADCHPGALRVHVAATRRGASLVHFRRWRGCGLRFQRLFLSLRAELAPALAPAPPPPPDPPLRAPAPMEEDT